MRFFLLPFSHFHEGITLRSDLSYSLYSLKRILLLYYVLFKRLTSILSGKPFDYKNLLGSGRK